MTAPARPARDRLAEGLAGMSVSVDHRSRIRAAFAPIVADALLAPDGAVTELIAEAVAEARTDLADDFDNGPLYAAATRYFADRDVDADGVDVARILRAAAAPEEGR